MSVQPFGMGQRLDRAPSAVNWPGPYSITSCRRTKSDAFSGEAKRAVPLVGSV